MAPPAPWDPTPLEAMAHRLQSHVGTPLQYILKRDRRTDGCLLAEQTGDTPQFYHVAALADLWLVAQSSERLEHSPAPRGPRWPRLQEHM